MAKIENSAAASFLGLGTPMVTHMIKPANENSPNRMECFTSVFKTTPKGIEANITLWQFLLELLLSNSHKDIIEWTVNEGEFKLINAEQVAKLWGQRKNKANMNYDKLSRALRYYYDKNIIKKVNGQKFVYRFVSFPEVVKTENKVPFKVKMEEYGGLNQLSSQPFSTYIYDVRPPGRTETQATTISVPSVFAIKPEIKTEPVQRAVTPPMIVSHVPQRNVSPLNLHQSVGPVVIRVENFGEFQPLREMPNVSKCVPSVTLRPSSVSPVRMITSNSKIQPAASRPSSSAIHTSIAPAITQSLTTQTVTGLSRLKPNPLNLPTTAFSDHVPSPSAMNNFTFGIAHPISASFTGMSNPMLVSPSGAQKTPIGPLHFWSSLSPVATLSPRLSAATNTQFQFPSFPHMTLSPLIRPSITVFDNLQTPKQPKTKGISVS